MIPRQGTHKKIKFMKKTIILCSFILALFALANDAAAQKTKMIVNDYYLNIPQEYIKIDRVQRAKWISEDDAENGYLEFDIPFMEGVDMSDAEVWGRVQLFPGKNGKMYVGLIVNRCVESVCDGNLLMLEYAAGKWKNVSDLLVPNVENSEIVSILRDSPSYERPIEDDEEFPLALGFDRYAKVIQYMAACTSAGCDGATVAKMFKWNGAKFEAFDYPEGL